MAALDNPPAVKPAGRPAPLWPLALALAVRLAAWWAQPTGGFANDEASYIQTGTALRINGVQDLFWPPFTGWLIAIIQWGLTSSSISALRLAWIAMDIGCVAAVRALAARVAPVIAGDDAATAARYTTFATLAYALYLPAISHAQFVTSETPALLLTLLILLTLSRPSVGVLAYGAGGVMMGALALTRLSLAPLLVLLPIANADRKTWRHVAIFVLAGTSVLAAAAYRNRVVAGETTLGKNSAYNLYIGNRDFYAEDLDLFVPMATKEQVEFRRQFFFGGGPAYPVESAATLQREALLWIATHPFAFAKRAIGRLARVFVPKTDVLELIGGEANAGIFSARSVLLLVITNVEWAIVLFGGVAGLVWLWRARPDLGRLFGATILGSVALCLVAISKPRYSFVFDPLLILGATLFVMAPRRAIDELDRADHRLVGAIYVFLIWGWVAWLIFAVSSRLQL